MSAPVYTGLEAPFRTKVVGGPSDPAGAILDVGRGDWQQGDANGDPLDRPKWIATVDVDGRRVWGVTPQVPFAPGADVVLPGEQSWETRLRLDLARLGFADGRTHTLTTRIYAASFWPGGWGDNAAQPAGWEWGHYNAGSKTTPALFAQTFLIPSSTPPPDPAPPSLTWYRDQALKVLDEAVRVHGAAVTDSTRVRHMLRVGRTTDAKRKLVDGALDRIGV